MDENKEMQAVVRAAATVVGVCARWLLQKEERKKRKREHHYLRRRNVPPPTRSAMATMMKGDDETYLFLFRMRKESFKRLLVVFEPIWWTKHLTLLRSVQKQSTRQLTPNLALALVLRYLLTTSEGTDAAPHFGLLQPKYSIYLRHGIRCLKEALQMFPETTFTLPTLACQEYYADVITTLTDNKIRNVWGAVDGICLYFESSGDIFVEGDHFSGFKHRPVKKLLCVFAPDGSICGATWGRGTLHDSDLWRPLAVKMELQQRKACREPRLRVLGDAAFPHSRVCFQATQRNASDTDRLRVLRRVRNFSEIGLGSLTKGCRRLNVKLPSDDPDMVNIVISTSLLLLNYRIRIARVGQLLMMHYDVMGDSSGSSSEESDEESEESDEESDEES